MSGITNLYNQMYGDLLIRAHLFGFEGDIGFDNTYVKDELEKDGMTIVKREVTIVTEHGKEIKSIYVGNDTPDVLSRLINRIAMYSLPILAALILGFTYFSFATHLIFPMAMGAAALAGLALVATIWHAMRAFPHNPGILQDSWY